ncbi:MAG: BadF/BadG/BcrA/BcrD ATPase family protein [Pseudomonadota bacterium]
MTKGYVILGVDGGGTKTAVRVAALSADGEIRELARAVSGPSNLRAVGVAAARATLDAVIDEALAAAAVSHVHCAVLALAGSQQPAMHAALSEWAAGRRLAAEVAIVHDIGPVLAVADRGGPRLGLIVGTGTVAGSIDRDGERRIRGGWGYWFGDQGSGFDLGRRALAAVSKAADGVGPGTLLTERILAYVGASAPRSILEHLDRRGDTRREIAACARVALDVADEGDPVALGILEDSASEAALLLHVTADRPGMGDRPALGLGGGVVCSSEGYRGVLLRRLAEFGTETAEPTLVKTPVEGSLIMAREHLLPRGQAV